MERKPFHEVILDEMKMFAEDVGVSIDAERKLKLFGDIFSKAILPKDRVIDISNAIKDLAANFPNASDDTKFAQRYLESLAEDVGKQKH